MSRMRPLLAAALLLFLAALATPAAAGESAADSAYRDYRIPDHRWWQWVAGVSGSASHWDQSVSPDQHYRSGSFRGQLATAASGGHETDALDQSWAADLRFSGDRRHDEQFRLEPGGEVTGEFSDRLVFEGFNVDYSLRTYPWSFPLALSAGTSQRLDFQQAFSSSEFLRRAPSVVEQSLSSSSLGAWNYLAGVDLGTGVGRVRDATPVYQAQVLEDRLLETGSLARPLTRPARERLAALFATQGRFVFAHGRPDKYFWGELERVLAEDSALANGSIDLYDAHRILEPVTIKGRVLRSAGWFVGPSVFLVSFQQHDIREQAQSYSVYLADTLLFSSGSGSSFSDYSRQDRIQTAIVAEYHHPAGHRWQYDAGHTTRIGESGVPMFSNTNASVMWIVSDRWLATGFLGHALEWNGHGTDRGVERWNVGAGVDVSYFLEDSWALTVTARENQAHDPDAFRRNGDFAFSITRVISGLFEAPGLVSAMRPSPGGR
jgi:hypothetical protein